VIDFADVKPRINTNGERADDNSQKATKETKFSMDGRLKPSFSSLSSV